MPPRDLGAIFDEDPDRYDRARPGYPRELFDDLLRVAGLTRGARVVGIGPGTGQATSELVARGLRVTAVEAGAGLAGGLRRKYVTTSLEVAITGFEAWRPDVEPFDAVVAFTAWHWLDPALSTARRLCCCARELLDSR